MRTHFISKAEAKQILENYTEGTIFTVTFIKRGDGSKRVMNCRKGVQKGITGQGMPYDPKKKNLIPVYDMQVAKKLKQEGNTDKKAFRMISLEGVTEMKMRKIRYIVG